MLCFIAPWFEIGGGGWGLGVWGCCIWGGGGRVEVLAESYT